jgi:hypothetical protein
MAILRAGPWGNLNNPHQDEPAVKDDQTNIFPVNCARGNWTNQPWRLLYKANSDIDITTGTAALGSPIVANGDIYATVLLYFNWQATQDFDVDLQWDITSTDVGNVYPTLEWQWYTIEGTNDYLFDTPADVGTDTITLPASTFGTFWAYVDGFSNSGTDVQTEASII